MKALAAALVEAQKEMPTVQKDAMNPHFGKPFVSLDHLIAKTKPVLTKHGLVIVQNPHVVDGHHVLRTSLIHGASGDLYSADTPLLLNGKNDMQSLGAAITYARRYAWASVLGICDEADDDGNEASAPGTGASQASASTEGGAADRAAVTAPLSQESPAAPTSSSSGTLKWKYGVYAGKTIEETPLDFVINYAETGKPGFMVDKCKEFLAENGHLEDDGIPF